MRHLLSALTLVVFLALPAFAQNSTSAPTEQQLRSRKFPFTFKAAFRGDAEVQNSLGEACRDGEGVAQNDERAVLWFRKAADQGHADAQNNLGFMYKNGRGVVHDDTEAVNWYRKAADQGDAEAAKWYGKAADQGDPRAQCNLGIIETHGAGATVNKIVP